MIVYVCIVILMAALLAFCFLDAKGRVPYILLLVLMFVLFAYMRSTVDIGAYMRWYQAVHSISDITVTDPAFGFLMLTGKALGLDFYSFLGYIGILGLFFLSVVLFKYSRVPAIVLALYFIFDFSAEIIQLRAFFAEIVLYILLVEIIEKKKFQWLQFFLLLVLGVLFHSTSVFFALMLLPVFFKSRKTLLVVVLGACLMVPFSSALLKYVPVPILQEKLQYYVEAARSSVSMAALLYVTMFLGVSVLIAWLLKRESDHEWNRKLGKLLNIHIVCIIACVMTLYFTSNFYRILRTVMVADFIVLGNYFVARYRLKDSDYGIASAVVFATFMAYEFLLKGYQTILRGHFWFEWLFEKTV